jgi:hypothetical protein
MQQWLGGIVGWAFFLFLAVGLPLWIYFDGLGANCVNDPGGGDPHCHAAISPHDLTAAVAFGGIWWIAYIGAAVAWAWCKWRSDRPQL